jgi:hypothetical protein
VYAVFVTFHFESLQQPPREILEAHQALLNRIPRLKLGYALKSRSEYAYLLLFERQRDIDVYVDSQEFCRFRSSAGCYDAFVKVYDFLMSTGEPLFDLSQHHAADVATAAAQSHAIAPL